MQNSFVPVLVMQEAPKSERNGRKTENENLPLALVYYHHLPT